MQRPVPFPNFRDRAHLKRVTAPWGSSRDGQRAFRDFLSRQNILRIGRSRKAKDALAKR